MPLMRFTPIEPERSRPGRAPAAHFRPAPTGKPAADSPAAPPSWAVLRNVWRKSSLAGLVRPERTA